jgi:hypothetical protein
LRIDAHGKETQLEELQSRYYRYVIERRQALADTLDKEERGQVYLLEDSRDNDPHMRFIFTDKAALQGVRFRHFVSDCQKISGDRKELQTLEEQEKQAADAFIEDNFRDIEKNFDPSVIKFCKKRKIILADGALNDLMKDS